MDTIEVSLDRIKDIVNRFDDNEFSTADVLRKYSGGFYSNQSTPDYYSFNAQFGKLLGRNSDYVGFSPAKADVSVKDDNGHPTSS